MDIRALLKMDFEADFNEYFRKSLGDVGVDFWPTF